MKLRGVHGYPLWRNYIAQKGDCALGEFTLSHLGIKLMFNEALKDVPDVLNMLL